MSEEDAAAPFEVPVVGIAPWQGRVNVPAVREAARVLAARG